MKTDFFSLNQKNKRIFLSGKLKELQVEVKIREFPLVYFF